MIHKKLLTRIEEKMGRLNSLRSLPADTVIRLHDEMRLLHTYHSNAIEGNTLTLYETKLVLEEGTTIGGKSLREHLEATNNAKAFDLVEDVAKKKKPIDHVNNVEIHPFIDGNGRVARLLANLYLFSRGYPVIVLKSEERGKYYKFLRAADAGNLGTFANFIAKAVDESLTIYLSIYGGIDELLPLKEYLSEHGMK